MTICNTFSTTRHKSPEGLMQASSRIARACTLAIALACMSIGMGSSAAWASGQSDQKDSSKAAAKAAKPTTSFGSFVGSKTKAAPAPVKPDAPVQAAAKPAAVTPAAPKPPVSFGLFKSSKPSGDAPATAATQPGPVPAGLPATAINATPAVAVKTSRTMADDLAQAAAKQQALNVLDKRQAAVLATGAAAGAVAANHAAQGGGVGNLRTDSAAHDELFDARERSRLAEEYRRRQELNDAYRMGRADAPTSQVIVVNRDRGYGYGHGSGGVVYGTNNGNYNAPVGGIVNPSGSGAVDAAPVAKPTGTPLPWMGLILSLLAIAAIVAGVIFWQRRKKAAESRYAL